MSKFGPWTTGALAKAPSQKAYDLILQTVPTRPGPGSRLADFGYFYNDALQLRQIANPEEGFVWLGQKHYDHLGEAVVEEIYTMMQQRYGLVKLMLPLQKDSSSNPRSTPEHPRVPIFISPNFNDPKKAETVFVICQGVGAVRPGMWARSLCINNSLRDGTIFTYLEFAQQQGWPVIVLNPNENSFSPITVASAPKRDAEEESEQAGANLTKEVGDWWLTTPDAVWKGALAKANHEGKPVEDSECQEDHGATIWRQFVQKSPAKIIHLCAHSYGGRVSTRIVDEFFEESVRSRVASVAWTDAINDNLRFSARKDKAEVIPVRKWLRANCRNWVASGEPLGTPIRAREGYDEVSAGHKTHEWTSAACAPDLFNWVLQKHATFKGALGVAEKAEKKAGEDDDDS